VLLLQTGAVAPLARQAQTYRAAAPERPRRQRVPRIRSPASSRSSYFLFGLGIVGTGMLAAPVLTGCVAYAMADTFRWRNVLA
jgi:Mn2+/Fe2+ NRAMP family transporter